MRKGGPSALAAKAAATVAGILLLAAGCGEGQGVAEDAAVSVYVSEPLCAGAKRELVRDGGRAGGVRPRVVCADDTGAAGPRLAAIGAAARRATEDSSSVAYLGSRDPTAIRFSEPILEEADVARISAGSGAAAMARLLRALRRAEDSGSLRDSLGDELR